MGLDFGVAEQADNHMHMIRHHHKITHVIVFAVEVQKTRRHNLTQFRSSKNAGPMALIESIHKLTRKGLVKFLLLQWRKVRKLCPPV